MLLWAVEHITTHLRTMGHPKFKVSNQKEESISTQRVVTDLGLYPVFQSLLNGQDVSLFPHLAR